MKIVFLIFAVFFVAKTANAQSENQRIFKPFNVDISTGFAQPLGGGDLMKGGVLFAAEPKYAVANQFVVGLRFEVAAIARVTAATDVHFESDKQGNGSFVATGDYYLSNNQFRPFIGAGAGLYRIKNVIYNPMNPLLIDEISTDNEFGIMFRGGFEAGHFRLGIEYNAVGKSQYSAHNSYIGFKVGTCIGGGRYKK